MQSNRGSEYFKNLIKDKTRLKRWRKMILCLSCVVVFCTVYALILPALTLERKTICGQEEHMHTEACYSTEGQLICGKEEHTHTETCYADTQAPNSQTEDNTEQNQDSEQNKTPDVNEADSVQDVENEAEAENVAETPTAQANEAIMMAAEPAAGGEGGTGSTTTATEGFDLSADTTKLQDVSLQYYDESSKSWVDIPDGTENEIPGNVKIRVKVQYKDIPIEQLIRNHNCAITYPIPIQLRNVATGNIVDGSRVVGHTNVQNGKIVVTFNQDYLNELNNSPGTSTIAGNFYVEGKINLSQLDDQGKTTLTTADKQYQLNFGSDALAKYAEISVKKECSTT